MKFRPLIEYNVRKCFLKIKAENEAKRLVPDLFLLFKKALYEINANGNSLL